MTVLLTRLAVLQGAIEATYNTPATVGVDDGFLVNNPTFTVKPNVLERNFVRQDLSPLPVIIGRKVASMTFETELRGNGLQNSGLLANSPLIVRLFQACGYEVSPSPMPSVLGPYIVGDAPTPVDFDVSSGTVASQVLTMSAEPTDGNAIVVGNKTYMWKTALTGVDGQVAIGGSEAQAVANLVAAINLGAGAGTAYAAATVAQPDGITAAVTSPDVMTVTAPYTGAYYDTLPTTTTSSQGLWGGGTLSGGANIASNSDVIAYYLTVTTPGASGVAQLTVTSDTTGEATAAATATNGSPFSLGTKGLTITPTWTGSLVAGQQWVLWLLPSGIMLSPISDNFQSITLALHKDGVLHTMPGSFGTFEITAQAGNFAMVKWTFTGTYDGPVDDPNPSPDFETTLPSQVQLARLTVAQFQAIVEKFTYNQANDIQIRPDVSASDGYIGVRITARKPEGGIDPEADLVVNNDFWGQFAAAQRMPLQMRVGTEPGNTIWVFAPNTQYTGLTYTDRNGILAYDAGLRFSRSTGNDEFFVFCA
jgi:hypothetical protein